MRWLPLFILLCSASAQAIVCTVTTTGLAFGNYDQVTSVPTDSTGTMTITCTGIIGVVQVDLGPSANGTMLSRVMKNGIYSLNYQIYLDLARTQIFGNGTGGTVHLGPSIALLALGVPTPFTLYGRIPARQVAAVGTYSDSMMITVSF